MFFQYVIFQLYLILNSKYQIDQLTIFWTIKVLRKTTHIPRISMIYSKIWYDSIPCFAKFFIPQNVNDGFCWFSPLLISNIKYTECQWNQNKFNQFYYTLLIHNFIDDKRKTLALKIIMVRWIIKISLISSKLWEYDIRYVFIKIGKYQ